MLQWNKCWNNWRKCCGNISIAMKDWNYFWHVSAIFCAMWVPLTYKSFLSYPLTSFFPNPISFSPHFTIFPHFPNRTSFVSLQLRFQHFASHSFTLSSRCPRSSIFFPLLTYSVGNVPSVIPCRLSPILPVLCSHSEKYIFRIF